MFSNGCEYRPVFSDSAQNQYPWHLKLTFQLMSEKVVPLFSFNLSTHTHTKFKPYADTNWKHSVKGWSKQMHHLTFSKHPQNKISKRRVSKQTATLVCWDANMDEVSHCWLEKRSDTLRSPTKDSPCRWPGTRKPSHPTRHTYLLWGCNCVKMQLCLCCNRRRHRGDRGGDIKVEASVERPHSCFHLLLLQLAGDGNSYLKPTHSWSHRWLLTTKMCPSTVWIIAISL